MYGQITLPFILTYTRQGSSHIVKGKFSLMWSKNLLKLYFVLQFENNMLDFENNR